MSTIKLVPVSVNGHAINLAPVYVHTCPHGNDREKIENSVEYRLISKIDREPIMQPISNHLR